METITVNNQIGVKLLDDPTFKVIKTSNQECGKPYLVGMLQYKGRTVEMWVDPWMRWNDTRIIQSWK